MARFRAFWRLLLPQYHIEIAAFLTLLPGYPQLVPQRCVAAATDFALTCRRIKAAKNARR